MSGISFPGGGGSGVGSADPTSWVRTVFPAANLSTASATFVAIDDTNLPISVDLVTGDVVVMSISTSWGMAGPGNVIGVDWNVDRPVSADLTQASPSGAYGFGSIEIPNTGVDGTHVTVMGIFTATEDGVHIFKPRWKVGGGTTAYIFGDAASYSAPIVHEVRMSSAGS
jgi:hypothetical protein